MRSLKNLNKISYAIVSVKLRSITDIHCRENMYKKEICVFICVVPAITAVLENHGIDF